MTLTAYLKQFAPEWRDVSVRDIERAIAARRLASIPGDIFFPVIRTDAFGIARKLKALEHLAPGCTDLFVRHGAHNNISARATERALCNARQSAISASKIELSATAYNKALARRAMAEYLGQLQAVETRPAVERLAEYRQCAETWAESPRPGVSDVVRKRYPKMPWHPGAGSFGICPKDVEHRWTRAIRTGEIIRP